MKESLLHFIWQYLHLNVRDLTVESGETLSIIRQGTYQQNAGPDFENCRIALDGVLLAGNIEIHIRSSDWYAHQHQKDPAYNNVILHVVWEHDREVEDSNGHRLPVLVLKGRVRPGIIERYEALMEGREGILCKNQLESIPPISHVEMIDRAVSLRLQAKSTLILRLVEECDNDWEETAYRVLLQNFGFKVNHHAFQHLAQKLPYRIIRKHLDQPKQVEALLFGMSGFLEGNEDQYQRQLREEFDFLAAKYDLTSRQIDLQEWKFLRLRPANFPTVRLAQLSAFLLSVPGLFSFLTDENGAETIKMQLRQPLSSYWKNHYHFGKKYADEKERIIGIQSVENISINTIAPLLVAYGIYTDNRQLKDRALRLLEDLKPERNHIITKWREVGLKAASAHDSQGLIMQYNEFCLKKRCLECAVGNKIVNRR